MIIAAIVLGIAAVAVGAALLYNALSGARDDADHNFPGKNCGSSTAPCPLKEDSPICPGKTNEEMNKEIEQAQKDQVTMLEAKKAELNRWNDADKAKFKKWFGSDDDASKQKMIDRIDKEIAKTKSLKTADFRPASADEIKKTPNLYAYVYPNKDDTVYLGPAFCSAPATGKDSKAGTLCHEMSHYDSVAGTKDNAYGQTKCLALAASKPAKAFNNADSFEYFCEDN